VVFRPEEIRTNGADDPVHLREATSRGALLVTFNIPDFVEAHRQAAEAGQHHAGILLCRQLARDVGRLIQSVERAARLLTTQAARDQLLFMEEFATEDGARARAQSMGVE